MTTPAPERGAGSDEPTGRLCFGRVGPSDGLLMGSVRTSFSVPSGLRFSPCSWAAVSQSTTISTALAVRKRPAAPTPVAISGGSRGLPLTRPAEPHPTGRQRVRGEAQSRLIDCFCNVSVAVGGWST